METTTSYNGNSRTDQNPLDCHDILLNAPIGIFISTPEGRFVSTNPTLAKMYGYETSENIIESITDIGQQLYANPADREEFKRLLETHGEVVNFEYQLRRFDGSIFWVSTNARAIRDQNGIITHYQGFATDIDNRKLAEEKMLKSEKKYRALFENSLDAIFLTVPDGKVFAANKTACEMVGRTELELIAGGRNIVIDPNDSRLAEALKERALKKKFRGELNFLKKDGSSFPVEISSGIYEEDYDNKKAYIIARDFTERKQAEGERKKLQEQLLHAQKIESIGTLAGGVAHEFNNRLCVINLNAEMALNEIDTEDPSFPLIKEILDTGLNSAVLVRQLMAFARKEIIKPVKLDLNKTVGGVLNKIQKLMKNDISINFTPGNNLWHVKMDPSQIDQILTNLCNNAQDAIMGKGKVNVETENVTFDRASDQDNADFLFVNYVMLTVSDDGCGMDSEIQGKMFDPFFTTKQVGKGTGLGLSTVYGIVKQNDGFINVYSGPGKGSIFRVYIPRHVDDIKPEKRKCSAKMETIGSETILVVEDEPQLLDLCKKILKNMGYQVIAATTPGEAIRLVNDYTGKIQLLLSDVVMPEMNGQDLAERMSGLYPDIKCIFMSGHTDDIIAQKGTIKETVDFIEKPFSIKKLTVKVQKVLSAT